MTKYLLDTHAFIWQATGSERLSHTAKQIIASENQLLISKASIWEMAIKVSIGKLSFQDGFSKKTHPQQISTTSAIIASSCSASTPSKSSN